MDWFISEWNISNKSYSSKYKICFIKKNFNIETIIILTINLKTFFGYSCVEMKGDPWRKALQYWCGQWLEADGALYYADKQMSPRTRMSRDGQHQTCSALERRPLVPGDVRCFVCYRYVRDLVLSRQHDGVVINISTR